MLASGAKFRVKTCRPLDGVLAYYYWYENCRKVLVFFRLQEHRIASGPPEKEFYSDVLYNKLFLITKPLALECL